MLAKKPRGATEKRKSSSVSGLLWMFVGAILTLMIGVFIYLSPLFNFSPTGSETAADADRQIQPRVETDTDNADYEFYDILPNQERFPEQYPIVSVEARCLPWMAVRS